jgi:uncharacterized heparinase superfamily protein
MTGMTAGGAARLARTAIQLRPAQVGQRVRLRCQRVAINHSDVTRRWLLSGPASDAAAGWPAGFIPLDALVGRTGPGSATLPGGEATLLSSARARVDWVAADAPLLWRFHLYYWDWAWALAAEDDRPAAREQFGALWESWHAAVVPGHGAAWWPYPAAQRAWSWCGLYDALVKDSPAEAAFRDELAAHAGFLRRNLETDVGGNHLVKNLKALAGLAVFFGDEPLLAGTLRRLGRQLAVQVLPDGGHYERAPAYHCQVLGDLIDIAGLLRATGLAAPDGLRDTIARMRAWLGLVLTPDGEVPLLNDGFPVAPGLLAALRATVPRRGGGHVRVLRDTGLARVEVGGWHLLADIGLPCPRELPAHAHADTLGCLVHLDGEPLLIDTGTSTYEAGATRNRERSTAAHNTIELNGQDSTEVWGAFRAGRRARVRGVSAGWCEGVATVEAAHDGYRHLPGRPRHHRRWSLSSDELRIDDTVTGQGRHRIIVRWHLAPGAEARLASGGAVIIAGGHEIGVTARSELPSASPLAVETAEASVGFGKTIQVPVLTYACHAELPVRISTTWRRARHLQGST